MTDREKHIKNLSYIMDSMPDDTCGDWRDSLAYAISSLKIDEAYQLMYEGEEIYTKDDMVTMLTEILTEMEEYEPKWAENDEQAVASNRTWEDLDDIIREKINILKDDGGKKV